MTKISKVKLADCNLYINRRKPEEKLKVLGGTSALGAKISELREKMAAGPRECSADSDCGDTTKVCCSETQVAWVVCSGGECASEKEDCSEGEICSGKPAQCTSASEGTESTPITISRVYIIGSPCNSTIEVLNLQKKDENSARFEIVGNVPSWLGFSTVGGALPQNVDVTVDCNTLQTEGTYEASVSIKVLNADRELINTIPINISIEAVASILDDDDDAISTGDDIDLVDPEEEEGEAVTTGGDDVVIEEEEVTPPPTEEKQVQVIPHSGSYIPVSGLKLYTKAQCDCCDTDHYHAPSGSIPTLNGVVINDPFSSCGIGRSSLMILITPSMVSGEDEDDQ